MLTPYRSSNKITLIKAASFHRDFETMGLPIRELPSVFMSSPLTTTKPTGPPSAKAASSNNTSNGTNGSSTKPVCKHFQKVSFYHEPLHCCNTVQILTSFIRESADSATVASSNTSCPVSSCLRRNLLRKRGPSTNGLRKRGPPQLSWVAHWSSSPPLCRSSRSPRRAYQSIRTGTASTHTALIRLRMLWTVIMPGPRKPRFATAIICQESAVI